MADSAVLGNVYTNADDQKMQCVGFTSNRGKQSFFTDTSELLWTWPQTTHSMSGPTVQMSLHFFYKNYDN